MKKSLIALAFGTLGLGISEFGMMSILSVVAESLKISISDAGHFVSMYAIGVCIGAILLVFLSKNHSLKTLLIILMVIMCLGNLIAVLAPNYETMLIARFISGLPHGAFFGVAGIAAKHLADKGRETEAVCIMISGMTVANLLGIPLASFITHIVSWHMLFLIVVLWGLFTIFSICVFVPSLPSVVYKNFSSQFAFLKHRLPWLLLATIMLGNGGLFCWYSYINPIMVDSAGFIPAAMAPIMLLSGLGMVLGNFTSSRLSSKISPVMVTLFMVGLIFISSLLMIYFSEYKLLALCLMFMGAFGLFGVSGPEQYLIIETASGGEILGASSAQVAFNLGNALGAYFGGIPVVLGYDIQYSAVPGVILSFFGIVSIIYFNKYYPKKQNQKSN